jgi:chromate transporter
VKNKHNLNWGYIARVFVKTGMYSFGGWATTALLLEKELQIDCKVITAKQLNGAVAYAQILPGATQVAIVSNVGYRLRGIPGALVATTCYLLPALTLITLFAFLYFQFAAGSGIMSHMGGLIAALGGVILANAYNIGKRHATNHWLWRQ